VGDPAIPSTGGHFPVEARVRDRSGTNNQAVVRPMPCALFALATWRITHLLVEEDGPADLVLRLRGAVDSSVLGQVMDCFYCASVWVALPFAVVLTRRPASKPSWWRVGTSRGVLSPGRVATWAALSGAACLLEQATRTEVTPAVAGESSAPQVVADLTPHEPHLMRSGSAG
jgi:hypothetical protein